MITKLGPAAKLSVVFPELYVVDRCYGGPEEGGWWWDAYSLRHTFTPRTVETNEDREHLRKALHRLARFLNFIEGNRPISSVLSNGEICGTVSQHPSEFTTKERPTWS